MVVPHCYDHSEGTHSRMVGCGPVKSKVRWAMFGWTCHVKCLVGSWLPEAQWRGQA